MKRHVIEYVADQFHFHARGIEATQLFARMYALKLVDIELEHVHHMECYVVVASKWKSHKTISFFRSLSTVFVKTVTLECIRVS